MKIQSAVQSQASQVIAAPKGKDSDGDNDRSQKGPTGAKVGPAVLLSLTNTAAAKKPDLASGDPDHDGS